MCPTFLRLYCAVDALALVAYALVNLDRRSPFIRKVRFKTENKEGKTRSNFKQKRRGESRKCCLEMGVGRGCWTFPIGRVIGIVVVVWFQFHRDRAV